MRRPPRSIHHIRMQLDILKVDRSTASIRPLVCYTSPSSESLEARLGAPLLDTYPSMSRGNLRQRARTRQTQIASSVSHPSIPRVPRILLSSASPAPRARRQSNHRAVPLSTIGLNHASLYTHTKRIHPRTSLAECTTASHGAQRKASARVVRSIVAPRRQSPRSLKIFPLLFLETSHPSLPSRASINLQMENLSSIRAC